jgi:hypothetical protein
MADQNESYTVTTSTGDIVVPVEESVPYSNIFLLGWNSFNYQKGISQSLVNIADDITSLKDGGESVAKYDVSQLLEDAQLSIDTKIQNITGDISTLVEEKANIILEPVQENIDKLDKIITDQDASGNIPASVGLLSNFNSLKTIVQGDDENTSSIVSDLDTVKTQINGTIVNGTHDGSGILENISSLNEGLLNNVKLINNNYLNLTDNGIRPELDTVKFQLNGVDETPGVVSKLNTVINTVGNLSTPNTLYFNNNKMFIDIYGTIANDEEGVEATAGIISTLGDSESGLVHQVAEIQETLGVLNASGGNLLEVAEIVGGYNETTTEYFGMVGDIHYLKNDVTNIKTSLTHETTGIDPRLKILENLNLSNVVNTVNGVDGVDGLTAIVGDSTSGLVKDVSYLKSLDLSTLKTSLGTGASFVSTRLDNIYDELAYVDSENNKHSFTAKEVYDTIQSTNNTITDSINSQFKAYFYNESDSAYIDKNEIGSGYVGTWSDLEAASTSTSSDNLLGVLDADYDKTTLVDTKLKISKQVKTNKIDIGVLNSGVDIDGSVLHTIKNYDTNNNLSTDISTLKGDENVSGSVLHSIKTSSSADSGKVSTLTSDIDTVGSVLYSIKKYDTDNSISADISTLKGDKDTVDSVLYSIKKYDTDNSISADISTLKGDKDTVGSILHAVESASDSATVTTLVADKDTVGSIKYQLVKYDTDNSLSSGIEAINDKIDILNESATNVNSISGKIKSAVDPIKEDISTLNGDKDTVGSIRNIISNSEGLAANEALSTLTADIFTEGSVKYQINQSSINTDTKIKRITDDRIEDPDDSSKLIDNDQSINNRIEGKLLGIKTDITTLMGSEEKNVTSLIDIKIADNYNSMTTEGGVIKILQDSVANISSNNTSQIETLTNQFEEIESEMMRYSTMLPFFKKMFTLINTQGAITNDEIEEIFDTAIENIKDITEDVNNSQSDISYNLTDIDGKRYIVINVRLDKGEELFDFTDVDIPDSSVSITMSVDGVDYIYSLDINADTVDKTSMTLYISALESIDDKTVTIDVTDDNIQGAVIKINCVNLIGEREIRQTVVKTQ